MGVKKATFQSGGLISQHSLPGAYSRLDFVKGTGGLVNASNAVIFGDSRGGEPGKILWFTGPTEAEETLRSGTLLDAIKHAFNPGDGLVPQQIGAWRVNPGTRASKTLLNGATPMVTAYAWDYGLHTNQLKWKLETGTSTGKKLTIKFQNNDDYVQDNIAKSSFSIQYTGAGSAGVMSITNSGLTTTITAGPGGENLSIVFASFPTIDDLVNYINDQSGYTATLVTGVPSDLTTELDNVTAQDIKTGVYTAKSNLQAIIDALNDCPYLDEAVYYVGATTRLIPDNVSSYVYFTGAVDGAYTSSEWGTALDDALLEDIQFVGCSSNDASVHALIKSHCASANAVTGKAERQAIVGGAEGETVAQTITRAENLNSDAVMLAYPGFKHYSFINSTEIVNWGPVYYACKQLGAMVALAINEPATNKSVDILEWYVNLTRTEIEQLIEAGVSVGYKNKAGRLVNARTVTTYQGDSLQRNEFSMMREALYVSRDLRTALEESFVGHALTNSQLSKIDSVVIAKLASYNDLGLFNGTPPYWGYKKTILGDQVKVEYDCYLTPPTNFIFITSHMHVFASATA